MSRPAPALLAPEAPFAAGSDPRAVVLVLHGGRQRSTAPVHAHQLAVLRMVPVARAIAVAMPDVAVMRLRYRVRGWNGGAMDPVLDARAALDDVAARHPGVPVALVGHSMGGRTALRVADHPAVTGVVALAPWLPASEPRAQVAHKDIAIVHGATDRTTDPAASKRYADMIRATARAVTWIGLDDTGHTMLRRWSTWHELTARLTAAVLPDPPPASDAYHGLIYEPVVRMVGDEAAS